MHYDTNKLARALEAQGLKPEAADAIIESITTAHDKLAAKDELIAMETKLMSQIERNQEAFERRMDRIEESFARKIAETAHRQTVYIIGTIAAAVGILIAVMKLG